MLTQALILHGGVRGNGLRAVPKLLYAVIDLKSLVVIVAADGQCSSSLTILNGHGIFRPILPVVEATADVVDHLLRRLIIQNIVQITHSTIISIQLLGQIGLDGHITAQIFSQTEPEITAVGIIELLAGLNKATIQAVCPVEPLFKGSTLHHGVSSHLLQRLAVLLHIPAALDHTLGEQGVALALVDGHAIGEGVILGHTVAAGIPFVGQTQAAVEVIGNKYGLAVAGNEIQVIVIGIIANIVGIAQELGNRSDGNKLIQILQFGKFLLGQGRRIQSADEVF